MNREAINYYQSISPIIEEFCKPLKDYFGITLFTYYRAYHKDSSYILLTTNKNITQRYCANVNHEVLYSKNYLDSQGKYKLILWQTNPSNLGSYIHFNEGYWHGLTIVQKDGDDFECFYFLSNKDNHKINEFYIKYHAILERFIEYFKITFANSIINESKSYKAKYKNGCDFYLPEHRITINSDEFLQTSGINNGILNVNGQFVHLTSREKNCLYFINQGFSLKRISKQLLLSPRTIEIHLKNIRNKTGYRNKKDLIQTYRDSFFMENEL